MTGQDAVNVAQSFNEKLELTGIVLTRVDGDARGGAALSMKSVTGTLYSIIRYRRKVRGFRGVPSRPDSVTHFGYGRCS